MRFFLQRFIYLFILSSLLYSSDENHNPEDFIKREVIGHRIDKPLKIDGYLTEDLYQTTSNQQFIQSEPDNGDLATESTEVWVGYDDAALYIGARLWDSIPDSIVGRLARRDEDENSDEFWVAIDSYNDKRSGFYFITNPNGSIQDGTIANDSWLDDTWDGIWEWKTRIDDKGWTVEIRIPFSQLRFNKQEVYTWGINFARQLQRRNEFSLFIFYPRGESGMVSRFATLHGIANIDPPKRLEIMPYLTSGYSILPSTKDNPFYEGQDSNLGLGADVKLGLGSNLTLDVSINPDFGQVEVDPSTINLSDYETYYEEKRPFFVEGASIFSFGSGGPSNRWNFNFFEPDFFYSRRIGRAPQGDASGDWVDIPSATRILGAAKISGKLKGDWSLGGLTSLTKREFASIDTGGIITSEEVEPLTAYNLLRIQKEYNDGLQGLGAIGTHVYRDFKNRNLRKVLTDNVQAFGVDGWAFFNAEREWVIAGWIGATRVSGSTERLLSLQHNSSHYFQRPDAEHVEVDSNMTEMTGIAGRFVLNKEKGHWQFNTALGFITPGYESNDMGLNFGTDRINHHLVVGYRWYDPGKIFRSARLNAAYMTNHNFGGYKINESIFLFGWAQFLNYWSIDTFTAWGPLTLNDRHLRGGPMVESPDGTYVDLGFNSDGRKNIVFGGGGDIGFNSKGGDNYGVRFGLEVKIGTQLNLSFSPSYNESRTIAQYITTVDDPAASDMYGKRYVLSQIDQKTISTDIRIDYALSPTLSLQAYIQPFIAVGKYTRFKEFIKPRSYDFLYYGEEGSTITETESGYVIDPTGGDDSDAFEISNPDFNYKALVGNAVLRWEFKPGSTLYLVWTRNGTNFNNPGDFQLFRDLNDLMGVTTDNVFAIKVSYWMGK